MHSPISFLTVYVVVASVATVMTLLWGVRATISRAALTRIVSRQDAIPVRAVQRNAV